MKTRPSIVLLLGYHAPDSAAGIFRWREMQKCINPTTQSDKIFIN